jgi:hypothetical protein
MKAMPSVRIIPSNTKGIIRINEGTRFGSVLKSRRAKRAAQPPTTIAMDFISLFYLSNPQRKIPQIALRYFK